MWGDKGKNTREATYTQQSVIPENDPSGCHDEMTQIWHARARTHTHTQRCARIHTPPFKMPFWRWPVVALLRFSIRQTIMEYSSMLLLEAHSGKNNWKKMLKTVGSWPPPNRGDDPPQQYMYGKYCFYGIPLFTKLCLLCNMSHESLTLWLYASFRQHEANLQLNYQTIREPHDATALFSVNKLRWSRYRMTFKKRKHPSSF